MNYIKEKQNAETLLSTIKKVEKIAKRKTKNSRRFIRAAEEFINCHITNPAIDKKYKVFQELVIEMSAGTCNEFTK